jgi:hypothetical protein
LISQGLPIAEIWFIMLTFHFHNVPSYCPNIKEHLVGFTFAHCEPLIDSRLN